MRRLVVMAVLALALALGLILGAANAPTAQATLPIEVTTVLQASLTPDIAPGARWEGLHAVLYTSCVGPSRRSPFALPEEEFGLGTTRLTADMTRLYTPRGGRLLEVTYKGKNDADFRRVDGAYFFCTPLYAELAIAVFESTDNKAVVDGLKFSSKEAAKAMIEKVAKDEKADLSSLNGKLYTVEGQTYRIVVMRVNFT